MSQPQQHLKTMKVFQSTKRHLKEKIPCLACHDAHGISSTQGTSVHVKYISIISVGTVMHLFYLTNMAKVVYKKIDVGSCPETT
jgi:hypothetical protein